MKAINNSAWLPFIDSTWFPINFFNLKLSNSSHIGTVMKDGTYILHFCKLLYWHKNFLYFLFYLYSLFRAVAGLRIVVDWQSWNKTFKRTWCQVQFYWLYNFIEWWEECPRVLRLLRHCYYKRVLKYNV